MVARRRRLRRFRHFARAPWIWRGRICKTLRRGGVVLVLEVVEVCGAATAAPAASVPATPRASLSLLLSRLPRLRLPRVTRLRLLRVTRRRSQRSCQGHSVLWRTFALRVLRTHFRLPQARNLAMRGSRVLGKGRVRLQAALGLVSEPSAKK